MTQVDDLAARVAVLEGLTLFARTSREVVAQVAGLIEPVEVAAGTDVVTEGEAGDALWILVAGEVRVSAGDDEIRTVAAPAYFGEVATLAGVPRIATVSTTEPSKLWRISSDDFRKVIGPGAE